MTSVLLSSAPAVPVERSETGMAGARGRNVRPSVLPLSPPPPAALLRPCHPANPRGRAPLPPVTRQPLSDVLRCPHQPLVGVPNCPLPRQPLGLANRSRPRRYPAEPASGLSNFTSFADSSAGSGAVAPVVPRDLFACSTR
jgi:hypothetical protein